MSNVSSWSPIASNNTGTPPDGAPEGMPRSSTNDVMREMMAAVARLNKDTNGSLVTAGTGSAYTLTTNAADAALSDTSLLVFRVHAANGAAPTLSRDGLAAKAIKTAGGADLPAGVLAADQQVAVSYNATEDVYNLHSGINVRVLGEVINFAGSTAPSGWLLCFGQAISRTTYAALFAVVGTTYGAGDGSTTFNVPDLRGRVVAGQDDMGGTSANRLTAAHANGINGDILGNSGGAETHTLTASEGPIRNHTHNAGGQVTVDAGSQHVVYLSAANTTNPTGNPVGGEQSGAAHNNVQPTFILNYIIYTGV